MKLKFLTILSTILITSISANATEVPNLYKVTEGDNLQYIAKITYDNKYAWRDIYNANSDIISNPNLIYPGQVLILPNLSEDLSMKEVTSNNSDCENEDFCSISSETRHSMGKDYEPVLEFPENPWNFNLNRKK